MLKTFLHFQISRSLVDNALEAVKSARDLYKNFRAVSVFAVFVFYAGAQILAPKQNNKKSSKIVKTGGEPAGFLGG
jgi:hypothetical protein